MTAVAEMKHLDSAAPESRVQASLSNISLEAIQGVFGTQQIQAASISGTLAGKANAIRTRSVLVNGVPATWTAWQATWNAASVALQPGINKVLIQSIDINNLEFERAAQLRDKINEIKGAPTIRSGNAFMPEEEKSKIWEPKNKGRPKRRMAR